jgi:large subunit ribosomal protein L13e
MGSDSLVRPAWPQEEPAHCPPGQGDLQWRQVRHSRQAPRPTAEQAHARPLELLRPAVRCPTVKYNMRVRAGRGFTFEELKAAGIPRQQALTIGIPVDHRRRNRSEESLARNVQRLKAYKDKLILFPLKSKKPKKGDSQGDDLKADRASNVRSAFPIVQEHQPEAPRKITDEEKAASAYTQLRKARSDARFVGVRAERARKKAEEEEVSRLLSDRALLTFVQAKKK